MQLRNKLIGTPPDLAIVVDHIGRVENSLTERRVRDDVLLLLFSLALHASTHLYMIDSTVLDHDESDGCQMEPWGHA